MPKYTVTKEDGQIYIDGESGGEGSDMSGLPDGFHAFQWDGSNGHIEYTDVLKPNLIISSKSKLEKEIGVSLATLIERRTARIAEIIAEDIAANEELHKND